MFEEGTKQRDQIFDESDARALVRTSEVFSSTRNSERIEWRKQRRIVNDGSVSQIWPKRLAWMQH